jgi:hypothetical protein
MEKGIIDAPIAADPFKLGAWWYIEKGKNQYRV